MTRAQLAEAVAAWLYNEYGRIVGIDAHYVAKLERGVVRRPGELYRLSLSAVLHPGSDLEAGVTIHDFGPPRPQDAAPP